MFGVPDTAFAMREGTSTTFDAESCPPTVAAKNAGVDRYLKLLLLFQAAAALAAVPVLRPRRGRPANLCAGAWWAASSVAACLVLWPTIPAPSRRKPWLPGALEQKTTFQATTRRHNQAAGCTHPPDLASSAWLYSKNQRLRFSATKH